MKKLLCLLCAVFSATQMVAVGPISWGSPSNISTSGVSASAQQVAIDLSGNAVAVWLENGFVKASTIPAGGSWSAPVTLSGVTAGATAPQVAIDGSGTATAIWIGNSQVQVSQHPLAGSWSSATSISAVGASNPTLAVDNSGNVVAAWALGGSVLSKTKPAAGSWPLLGDTLSITGSFPTVYANEGYAALGWQDTSGANPQVMVATKTIEGVWSVGTAVSQSGINASTPAISIDDFGNTAAIWFRYDVSGNAYSNVILQSSYLPLNGNWSTPVDISEASYVNPALLQKTISIDDLGNLFASWNSSKDGASYEVSANLKPVGQDWLSPGDINIPNLMSYTMDSASDPSGFAVCVWQNYDPLTGNIDIQYTQTATKSNNLYFDINANLSIASPNTGPVVACQGNGVTTNAVAAWLYFDGTNFNLQSVLGTGSVISPISNLQGSQTQNNYGVVTEIDTNLSWTGSLDPRVVGYRIFRDGVLINSVDASTTTYVDNNRISGVSNTYGIGARDVTGFESTTVYITIP
ncbi:MAG: hypothetical protein JSS61_06980 [Verrucomicrobia bacterium]|nr:hypothetical protein [Verrucomicrobiota bacterium]